ncbi:Cerato-ulmin hydrophobin family [Phialemonium atrogriseum]|uniref:Cerato-ulmin hydrophobin family n=1 Tax=Phialemonium atrogriseum TaxID=1093897 RepID=A0AAJ0CC11_9PEZI|nr:Cerato-ulmin hydrophobin family [Phialemonium atrogriseum]KAK1771501.1 Cerato-ulmin hydrophobin family [Phialemonium atrogriseum]
MRGFTTVAAIAATCAGLALAAPGPVGQRQVPYVPCAGLYNGAQCCATDVLGVVDLDCGEPSKLPTSADDFSAVCAEIGQRARCCVLPILDQGVLCQTPSGVVD